MQRWTWIAGVAAAVAIAALVSQNAISQEDARPAGAGEAGSPDGLATTSQKMSYFMGYQLGSQFSQMDMEVDQKALIEGLQDAVSGSDMVLSEQQIRAALAEVRKEQQAKAKKRADDNLAEGKAFLEKNAKRDEVKVTDSGLQYEVIEKGEGQSPDADDRVTVHYEGKLLNGDVFDSSYDRGQPVTFPLNQVIPGWTEGLQLMKPGAKYKLYVPADLAYGASPQGPGGPNSTLVFTVELQEIKEVDPQQAPQGAGGGGQQ